MLRKFGLAAMASTCLLMIGFAYSQDDDLFSFIPDGGRTLLADLASAGLSEPVKKAVETGDKTGPEWLAYLNAQAGSDESLAQLDETQLQTLADYLGYNAPIPLVGSDVDTLPQDGRDLALRYCQSCHIITVVVTQDRAREAWLGTMNKPSHVGVDITAQQREALADYLVVNGGIPIEEVPPALRAGGASY